MLLVFSSSRGPPVLPLDLNILTVYMAAGLLAYNIGERIEGARRLHLNEFRFVHAPAVEGALRLSVDQLTSYSHGPDPALVGKLAAYAGVPAENVVVAGGSDEVLRSLIDITSRWFESPPHAIYGLPTYSHFEHYLKLRDIPSVGYVIGFDTTSETQELLMTCYGNKLARGSLVYMCTPNNPTGTIWSADSITRLANQYPKSLFIVDEAYIEFASADRAVDGRGGLDGLQPIEALNAASASRLALQHPNVVVVRTMSKAFGLAALRVGYAVASGRTLQMLRAAVSPKSISILAAPVVCAVLDAAPHYWDAAVELRRQARATVFDLQIGGWTVHAPPANFYMIYVGDAQRVVAELAAQKIQVRDRSFMPGSAGYIRVTLGTRDDNAAVVKALWTLIPMPPEAPPTPTPKRIIAQLRLMFQKTQRVLYARKVACWATFGTLLGVARHGGIIPTDDDIDLGYVIRKGEGDPVAPLVDDFRGEGLTLQRNRTDAYWQVGTNQPGERISPIHIDLFSYREDASGGYIVDDERFRVEKPGTADCNNQFLKGELFPLVPRAFYDEAVLVPWKAEEVLRRSLGEDCMRIIRTRRPDGSPGPTATLTDFSPA